MLPAALKYMQGHLIVRQCTFQVLLGSPLPIPSFYCFQFCGVCVVEVCGVWYGSLVSVLPELSNMDAEPPLHACPL